MNGVLLIDKPRGLTSHDVINLLRRRLGIERIGHSGTLDPDATGLLILLLGKATKVSQLLMGGDKSYDVAFRLGLETDTYDSTGKVVARRDVSVTRADLERALAPFIGEIEQRPPAYSAVKVKGKKLYEYARKSQEVEAPLRKVRIDAIRLVAFEGVDGRLSLACSKGTYVRSLVHDLGRELGCGAVTTEIRRTASGVARLEDAVPLARIDEAPDPVAVAREHLKPIASMLTEVPHLRVSPRIAPRILNGNGLRPSDFSGCEWKPTGAPPRPGESQAVLVLDEQGEALALGAFDGQAVLSVQRVL